MVLSPARCTVNLEVLGMAEMFFFFTLGEVYWALSSSKDISISSQHRATVVSGLLLQAVS